MAIATWLNVSPVSGSGSGSVSVGTQASHTGRVSRNTSITFRAAGVTDRPVSVTQSGKPEFVTIQATATAPKVGGNVTIAGKSNSKKLTFTLGTGDLAISLPVNFTAASTSTDNGQNITGDPGAAMEFDYSIVIPVGENESVDSKSKQIIVTDEGGHTATCNLTQAAGDAYLTVTPSSIELTWEGTAQNVTVASNTTWEVV